MKEVADHCVAVLGGDAFRVELHAVNGKRRVAKAHDVGVIGLRIDCEAIRNVGDNQRVIARGDERAGQACEYAGAIVRHGAGLSVHQPPAHDLAAEILADGLMAEAHAEQWQVRVSSGSYQIEADASFIGRAGAGREKEPLRAGCDGLCGGKGVVAHDFNLRAHLHQVMDKVPSEAVVIVDDEDHWPNFGSEATRTASRAAAKSAPLLASHSRCSYSGLLSATMPAPAWT